MNHLLFLLIALFIALPAEAQQQKLQTFERWDPTDSGVKTGPAVGERIPEFAAPDQNGKLTRFQDVKGPKGAVILFHRSADW
jgi:hypothetical protein